MGEILKFGDSGKENPQSEKNNPDIISHEQRQIEEDIEMLKGDLERAQQAHNEIPEDDHESLKVSSEAIEATKNIIRDLEGQLRNVINL